MDPSRISALLQPFLQGLPGRPRFSRPGEVLTPAQLDQISTYIDLLLRWNARINLTAVRDPESIVTRHFGESFFLARHLLPAPCGLDSVRALDIGSGAGFPGLPLKIWAPHISLNMIESNYKKAAFLREVARVLTLKDVDVISERAESLFDRVAPAALVTVRAVERFENIVPLATRFLAASGRLGFLIGSAQFPTLTRLTPQLSWQPLIPVPSSESRVAAISEPRT